MERWNLGLSAGAVAVSLAFASPRFAGSVAAGAFLELVNFRGLRRSGELFIRGRLPVAWQATFAVRFLLLAVGIGACLWAGAHPVGLVLGLSLMVPASIIAAWRSRPPVLDDAPAVAPDDPSWKRWNPWLARERDDDDEGEDW